MQGVPILIPWGTTALLSPGIVFLLTKICAYSRTVSSLPPSIPFDVKSIHNKWLSVPPDTKL